jgi:predicted PurR-regulated permease PerM
MNKIKIASYVIIAVLIGIVLYTHMAPSLLISMLLLLITNAIKNQLIKNRVADTWVRVGAIAIILAILISTALFATHFISKIFGHEDNFSILTEKLSMSVDTIKLGLPPTLVKYLPENLIQLQGSLGDVVKEHLKEITIAGKEGVHFFAHLLIACVIALLISLHSFQSIDKAKPLSKQLQQRLMLLGKSFDNIVFAQIKISFINTVLTGIFLFAILPMAGVDMPYRKTLIALTFFAGLLPIIGNLISNTILTIISLSVSFNVAIGALLFLIGIHKLEYFINAKIVGNKIHAAAWEILLAFLVMETCFGIQGLLLAPILYAYIKAELIQEQLI